MSVPAQTPVQIAWVTPDLAVTASALTGLLGVKKWIRLPGVHFGPDTCTYRGQPADFVADIALSYAGDMQLELIAPVEGESKSAEGQGAPIVQQGVMPGGMRFAYVTAAQVGVPYVEIAHIPPQIRAFFDYVKQEQR
jgi:hypothetical protein